MAYLFMFKNKMGLANFPTLALFNLCPPGKAVITWIYGFKDFNKIKTNRVIYLWKAHYLPQLLTRKRKLSPIFFTRSRF